jgi:2',3'-cyclic-nucleotide 2'-phosphodiesterase (5'-nucleotidase family)
MMGEGNIMTRTAITKLVASAALGFGIAASGMAMDDPVEDSLSIETDDGTVNIVTTTAAPDHLKDTMDTIYSGWHYRENDTRDMQRDDFDNPAMVFVDRGLDSWNAAQGKGGESCAGCYFDALGKTYGKMGGMDRVATVVKSIRAARPDALLLDGGDTWHGSMTSHLTKGQDVVDAMNALGCRGDDQPLGMDAGQRAGEGNC